MEAPRAACACFNLHRAQPRLGDLGSPRGAGEDQSSDGSDNHLRRPCIPGSNAAAKLGSIINPCVTEERARRWARVVRVNTDRATVSFDGCKTLRRGSNRLDACSDTPARGTARGRAIGDELVPTSKLRNPIPWKACSGEKEAAARRKFPTYAFGGTGWDRSHAGSFGDWACATRTRCQNDVFGFFYDLQDNAKLTKTQSWGAAKRSKPYGPIPKRSTKTGTRNTNTETQLKTGPQDKEGINKVF